MTSLISLVGSDGRILFSDSLNFTKVGMDLEDHTDTTISDDDGLLPDDGLSLILHFGDNMKCPRVDDSNNLVKSVG